MLYHLSWFAIADGTKHTCSCFRVVLSQQVRKKQNFRRFDRIELLFWQLTDFAIGAATIVDSASLHRDANRIPSARRLA
jgi:hypothetical protein